MKRNVLAVLAATALLSNAVFAQENDAQRRERENRENRDRGDRDNRGGSPGGGNGGGDRENRGGTPGGGNGGGDRDNRGGNQVGGNGGGQININLNDYYGRPTFELSEDRDFREASQELDSIGRQVDGLETQVKDIKKVIMTLEEAKGKLDTEISSLQDKIQTNIVKQQQLENSIGGKEQAVREAETAVQLAQKALEGAQAQQNQTQTNIDSATNELRKLETSCPPLSEGPCLKEIEALKEKIMGLNSTLEKQKGLTAAAVENKTQKAAQLERAKSTLASTRSEIESIKQQNVQFANQVNDKKNQRAPLITQLEAKRNELVPVEQRLGRERSSYEQKDRQLQGIKKLLIADIMKYNRLGFEKGKRDGWDDGIDDAIADGRRDGEKFGYEQGKADGMAAGIAAVRKEGDKQGRKEGIALANVEGETNGTRKGTDQGNIDAATLKGEADGTNRANNSDAAKVGKKQGEDAGMARAVSTGNTNGTKQGESEAINKYEGATLGNSSAFGSFAGSFQSRRPTRRENAQGRRFQYRNQDRIDPIMLKAFEDGRIFGYRRAYDDAYDSRIDLEYNTAFKNASDDAFEDFSTRDYPVEREDARHAGHTAGYSLTYPDVYASFFNKFREMFKNSPDVTDSLYKGTYKSVEAKTYADVYEDIRSEEYGIAESSTFNNNIAAQTEKYRALRNKAVSDIYDNNAVLKFVESSSADGGINEVAKMDGVYQAGETVYHSVVIMNFGKKAATGATLTLENGGTVTLPSLAGQSRVVVKGVAKSVIAPQTRVGTRVQNSMSIQMPLTAEAKIQGRHYTGLAQNIVGTDRMSYDVRFPLSLDNLKVASQLLIDQKNKMSIVVRNNSNRPYTGSMVITLTDDASSKVVLKDFAPIAQLSDVVTLNDAEVIVTDKRDAYRTLNFKASISQNGVKIGEFAGNYSAMAKAPYVAVGDEVPVVVVDSDAAASDLLDVVASLGGIEKASILDLSLTEQNNQVLNTGLIGKSIIVVDEGNGRSVSRAEGVLAKSKNSALLFVDDYGQSLNAAKRLPMFTAHAALPMKISGLGIVDMAFTNPQVATQNANVTSAMGADTRNFTEKLKFVNLMRLANDVHIAQIGASMNETSYFNPSLELRQLAEAYNTKIMGETLVVDKAYKYGGSRDKKILDHIKNNKASALNMLASSVKSIMTMENLGFHLYVVNASFTLDKAMNDFDPFETGFSSSAQDRADDIREPMEKKFKDNLKKFRKATYELVYKKENQKMFTPFTL